MCLFLGLSLAGGSKTLKVGLSITQMSLKLQNIDRDIEKTKPVSVTEASNPVIDGNWE